MGLIVLSLIEQSTILIIDCFGPPLHSSHECSLIVGVLQGGEHEGIVDLGYTVCVIEDVPLITVDIR